MFIKVAIVCPPGLTSTVAVPAPKLLLISNPGSGRVLTAAKVVFAGMVSVIIARRAGTSSGVLQEPPGEGPAGTLIMVAGLPAMLNSNNVPAKALLPATLQT